MARECLKGCSNATFPVTEHFQLPQWNKDTPTSWLVDLNDAMRKIDRLFYDFALRTTVDGLPDETVEEVVRLSNQVGELKDNMNTVISDIANMLIAQSNIQTTITNLQTRIETLTTNTVNLDTRMSTLESRMEAMELRMEKIENTYVNEEE